MSLWNGSTTMVLHANRGGLIDMATYTSGTRVDPDPYTWAGLQSPLYPRYASHARGTSWLGSLVANKHDGSGLVYMRNRYLNPQTGQFTQTDPIGLAGGLNLYGYAGGDPVNFHDPFGLTVIARGDANYRARVRRSIQWLAIRSPTFRQAMEAMQADGFRVYISEAGACAGMGRCVRRTGRRSVAVTFPLSDLGPSRSSTDWSLTDGFHLAHELMHAAGHLFEFIGENSGVPADCAKRDGDSPCAEQMTARIEREVREYNRAEEERENP